MPLFSLLVAALVSLGIIALGLFYLLRPRAATVSFGLPLPEAGANVAWWLRLKGVRDVVSGIVLVSTMMWSGPSMLGVILLCQALIPLGDMALILAARGSTTRALAVHGLTAVLMIAAAIPALASA